MLEMQHSPCRFEIPQSEFTEVRMRNIKIGVLALQGAFIEHEHMLTDLGAVCTEIRQPCDLQGIDGIVLPGGESTVQGQLLYKSGLFTPLWKQIGRASCRERV